MKKEVQSNDGRKKRQEPAKAVPEGRQAWAVLSEDDMKRPGAVLLGWLFRAANDRNMNLQELAKALDVSYGYISQLRGGVREVRGVGGQFLGKSAEFLGVPRIAVMIAAGVVTVEDFHDSPAQFAAEVDSAIQYIAKDATFGALMPADMLRASMQMKSFVVQLYQQATGRKLVDSAVDIKSVFKTVEEHRKLSAS